MRWFRSLIFLTIGCSLNHAFVNVRRIEERNCLSNVSWRELWREMEKVNSEGESQECLFMDKRSLCDPRDMVKPNVSEDIPFILKVLSEIAALFEMKTHPFHNVVDFIEYINMVQNDLKICLGSSFNRHQTTTIVDECFEKMKVFLNSGNHCAWQIVHEDSLVILQQLGVFIATSLLD